MKKCPHCGTLIDEKYIRCADCNNNLKAAEQTKTLQAAQALSRIEAKLDRILEYLTS